MASRPVGAAAHVVEPRGLVELALGLGDRRGLEEVVEAGVVLVERQHALPFQRGAPVVPLQRRLAGGGQHDLVAARPARGRGRGPGCGPRPPRERPPADQLAGRADHAGVAEAARLALRRSIRSNAARSSASSRRQRRSAPARSTAAASPARRGSPASAAAKRARPAPARRALRARAQALAAARRSRSARAASGADDQHVAAPGEVARDAAAAARCTRRCSASRTPGENLP